MWYFSFPYTTHFYVECCRSNVLVCVICFCGFFVNYFFSNKGLNNEIIRVDMERCYKSPDCRIYTVIDKKKENSMILCITVNDTQSFYVLTCSCQKNRKKRAVNSHVNHDEEKPVLEGNNIPAQCTISRDNRDYIPLKNKPMATTSSSANSNASIGHSDDTTNIVLICDRNVKEIGKIQYFFKHSLTSIYLIIFF